MSSQKQKSPVALAHHDDYCEALRGACSLRPTSFLDHDTLVISNDPAMWCHTAFRIVDVRPHIFKIWNTITFDQTESDLENQLQKNFDGYTVVRKYRKYLPNENRFLKCNLAVLAGENCLLSIYIVGPTQLDPHDPVGMFKMVKARSDAKWLCLTDGERYLLFDSLTAEGNLLERVPNKVDLSLDSASHGGLAEPECSASSDTPSLQLLLTKSDPRCLIIDFSIPVNEKVEFIPRKKHVEIRSLLPNHPDVDIHDELTIQDILLAWAASNPSLEFIVAVVARDVARSPHKRWLRSFVSKQFNLLANVELPAFIHPRKLPTSLVFLSRSPRKGTWMCTLKHSEEFKDFQDQEWFLDLSKWIKDGTPDEHTTESVTCTSWDARPLNTGLDDTLVRLTKLANAKPLKEFATVIPGFRPILQLEASSPPEPCERGSIPYVRAKDLTARVLDTANLRRTPDRDIDPAYKLRAGDILVPRIARGDSTNAKLITQNLEIIASNQVLIIRLKNSVISPAYLEAYLNSDTARRLISTWATSMSSDQEYIESLDDLPVPVIQPDPVSDINDLTTLEKDLQKKIEESKSLRLALFESPDAKSFQESVSRIRRLSKLMKEGLDSVDDLDYQLANFYPFPLAFSYRSIASIVNPIQKYTELLRTMENILAFLGSLLLAKLFVAGINFDYLDLHRKWSLGITPGTWKEIISRTTKPIRQADPYFFPELFSAIAGKEFLSILERFTVEKNDFKHDRGPKTEKAYLRAYDDANTYVRQCLRYMAPLTELNLLKVSDIDADRKGQILLTCLSLRGDHPTFHQVAKHYKEPVPKGLLYVEKDPDWLCLQPFISLETCDQCGVNEIFFVDKMTDRGALLKSFERGHTLFSLQVARELNGEFPSF